MSRAGRLKLALASLAIILVGGTAGLIIIEGMSVLDAFYMVIITLSTVGYGEVHPLHPLGKIFMIFVIIFGVVTVGLFATVIGEIVLEGQVREIVVRRRMDQLIAKLTGHTIIAGFGRVGRQVALEFVKRQVPFLVIDRFPEALLRLRELGYPYIEGDATKEETLRLAHIDRARSLVSTLPEEAQNVYLTLTAKYLNPDLGIIARAEYEDGERKLLIAGASHVIVPQVLGGIRMAMASIQPNVVDFMEMQDSSRGFVVEELAIAEGGGLAGKTLLDSRLKPNYGITVVGIKKQGADLQINPSPHVVAEPGDVLVIIGAESELARLAKDLGTSR